MGSSLAFAAVLALSWGRAEGVPRTFELSLQPGWNLITLPHGFDVTRLFEEGDDGLLAFGFDETEALSIEAAALVEPDEMTRAYWVYSDVVRSWQVAEGATHEGLFVASRAGGGWRLIGVSPHEEQSYGLPDRALFWDTVREEYVSVPDGASLNVGQGYWACCGDASHTGPRAPTNLLATTVGRDVQLSWIVPNSLLGGAPVPRDAVVRHQIYRRTDRGGLFAPLVETDGPPFLDSALESGRTYQYYVKTVVIDAEGRKMRSERSPIADLRINEVLVTKPGEFESPSIPFRGRRPARLVRAALSQHEGQTHALLLHVIAGEDGGQDTLQLLRNPRSGAANSWEAPIVIPMRALGARVTDVAIAAHKGRVSLGWVSRSKVRGSQSVSEVVVVEGPVRGPWEGSVEPTVIWSSAGWKQGLDVAYDPAGGHHLIWGESNKVFYAQNGVAEKGAHHVPLSVFGVGHGVSSPALFVDSVAVTVAAFQTKGQDPRVVTQKMVKLARRSLDWSDGALSPWQISVVDDDFSQAGLGEALQPRVSSDAAGRVTLVYEKGFSSDPNRSPMNPIYLVESTDYGRTFGAPERIAEGYVPQLAIHGTGRTMILYYVPDAAHVTSEGIPLGQVRVLTKTDDVVEDVAVSSGPVTPVHWQSHGKAAGPLRNVPTLAAIDGLYLAAWIGHGMSPFGRDHVVASRAREVNDVRQVSARLDGQGPAGGSWAPASFSPEGKVRAVSAWFEERSPAGGPWAPLQLSWEDKFHFPLDHRAPGLAELPVGQHPAGSTAVFAAAAEIESARLSFALRASASLGTARDNRRQAQALLHTLFREADQSQAGSASRAYQVEYLPDDGIDEADSTYLAQAERVWAYTQGIALAQRARSTEVGDGPRALGVARWLCEQGQRGGSETDVSAEVIKGWHFSQNTRDDDWKDARLVTGANAWVIQGLGSFLASDAFLGVEDLGEQQMLRRCYQQALEGLKEHRVTLTDSVVLMTAGWTTLGLVHARQPQLLDASLPAHPRDPEERWAYYDVLDAIGYEVFPPKPEDAPQIRTYRLGPDGVSKTFGRVVTVSEADWSGLRIRIKAQNVVTEHNLDVLSVLNHALANKEALGPQDSSAAKTWEDELRSWRDHLRKGIFEHLWDDQHWKADLEGQHLSLRSQNLGRIVTGGVLSGTGTSDTPLSFEQSRHVAIDNCSWLSLSVKHQELPEPYREKLAKCLRYTMGAFVRKLPFEDKSYYGAHYFKNEFRDPYIDESSLQEQSYHLEATTGLILGLLVYADAHPEHVASLGFRNDAMRLWAGVQAYVAEWGFPYSSQRIQDLSTQLSSSTAAIWFIDVYDYLQRHYTSPHRPLRSYASESQERSGAGGVFETVASMVDALRTFVDGQEQEADEEGQWVRSFQTGEEAVTRTEDQVLFVLAAGAERRTRGWDPVERRMKALLRLARMEPLPSAVWTARGQAVEAPDTSGHKLWVLYAIAWYLNHAPWTEGGAENTELYSAAQDAARKIFRRIRDRHLEDRGRLAGLFLQSDRGHEDQPRMATLRDNALAWFVCRELLLAAKGSRDVEFRALESEIDDLWVGLQSKLDALSWDEALGLPALAWVADGSQPASQPDAAIGSVFFALYSMSQGRTGGVLETLRYLAEHAPNSGADGLAEADPGDSRGAKLKDSAAKTDKTPDETGEPSGFAWVRFLGLPLVQRAAASFDPRQDELSLRRFIQLNNEVKSEPSTSRALSLLFLHAPQGFFGIDRVPFSFATSPLARGLGLGAPARQDLGLQKRLAHRMMDLFGALMASEFSFNRFDTFVHGLVRTHFAFLKANEGLEPEAWPSLFEADPKTPLLATLDALDQLCGSALVDMLENASEAALSSYLGVDCQTLARVLDHWREARGGVEEGDLERLIEVPLDRMAWPRFIQELSDPGPTLEPNDSERLYFGDTLAMREGALSLSPDAPLSEIREALRSRIQSQLAKELEALLAGGYEVAFRLDGVDPLRAENPAAFEYWRFRSVAYRMAMGAKGVLVWTAQGGAVQGPPFVSEPSLTENTALLREFINTRFDGRLVALASQSGLHAETLHRLLITGRVEARYLERILERTGPHDGVSLAAWRARFHVVEATAPWSPVDVDIKDRVSVPPPHLPMLLWGLNTNLVQHNILVNIVVSGGSKAAATQGAKGALGGGGKAASVWAKESVLGWLSGAAAYGVPADEIIPVVEPLLDGLAYVFPESPNVLWVREGASLPPSALEGFEAVELRNAIRSEDISEMAPPVLHHYVLELLADQTALRAERALTQNRGGPGSALSDHEAVAVELARTTDLVLRSYFPQTIVLHETEEGLKLYERFPKASEYYSVLSPVGIVAIIESDGSYAAPFRVPNPGFDWSAQGIEKLAVDLAPEHREAFLHFVYQLVTELLLGSTDPNHAEARLAEIRRRVTGDGATDLAVGAKGRNRGGSSGGKKREDTEKSDSSSHKGDALMPNQPFFEAGVDPMTRAVVPFNVILGPKQDRDQAAVRRALQYFGMLAKYPPNDNNLFHWKGSEDALNNKKVTLRITERTDPAFARMEGVSMQLQQSNDLRFVLLNLDPPGPGERNAEVIVLVDDMAAAMGEHRDLDALLLTELSRHVFSIISTFLRVDFAAPDERPSDHEQHLAVFTGSAAFLDGLLNSPDGALLSVELRGALQQSLDQTEATLENIMVTAESDGGQVNPSHLSGPDHRVEFLDSTTDIAASPSIVFGLLQDPDFFFESFKMCLGRSSSEIDELLKDPRCTVVVVLDRVREEEELSGLVYRTEGGLNPKLADEPGLRMTITLSRKKVKGKDGTHVRWSMGAPYGE